MRNIGLDLSSRHIAFCVVVDGNVVQKGSVRRLSELKELLGPGTEPARVAFEACREAWHVHDTMQEWGHRAFILDTTRVRQLGIGHRGRKNDAIDAEVIALALDAGRVPLAHVLSPARRLLRAKLSVRAAMVEMRAKYVTTVRGLARAKGVILRTSSTGNFLEHVAKAKLDDETQALIRPLVAMLTHAEEHLARVDAEIAEMVKNDPMTKICATAPGVAVIVAAVFISVIDDAKRFRNASSVGAYLGLVPSESTTGGPDKRRLGSITKAGNTHARAMLVQAAWQILRAGEQDDPLRKWAEQVAVRCGRKRAVIALARKLAGMLWAMCRDGTVYDPAFASTQSARGLRAQAQKQELVARAMQNVARKIQRRTRKAEALASTTSMEGAMS